MCQCLSTFRLRAIASSQVQAPRQAPCEVTRLPRQWLAHQAATFWSADSVSCRLRRNVTQKIPRPVTIRASIKSIFDSENFFSDFSSRPWRNFPPTWVIHMATCRLAHNTPIHMDLLYGFLSKGTKSTIHMDLLYGFLSKGTKSMWIGVLWAGLQVAM